MLISLASSALTGVLGLLVLTIVLLLHPALAGEVLPGPVRGKVLSVIDGDTIAVSARIWLGQDVDIHVRLVGIDAPELKARCAAERAAAEAARDALVQMTEQSGGEVVLTQIQYDKYGGRVLARVGASDGTDLAQALLARRLARPYDGRRREGWCS